MTDEAQFAVVVAEKVDETGDIVSFHLTAPDGGRLPAWTPGAHIDVRLPSGLVRQYSLNGDYRVATSYRIGVLNDPASRGGSVELHRDIPVGSELHIRPPRNRFELELADRYLFIAGGIGITPILPMIAQAEELGRPWRLVYGTRSRAAAAYTAELAARTGGHVLLVPQDEEGVIDLEDTLRQAGDALVYACGPAGMLAALEEKAEHLLGPGRLRVERFGSPPQEADAAERENRPFVLELARTGVTVTVPADRTTLEVVLDHVPDHLYGCQEGYCGTCISTVLAGVPEHRDSCLTGAEHASNAMMTPCVSRARSLRIVLDL
jgi:ferredoxin-NADP reductase